MSIHTYSQQHDNHDNHWSYQWTMFSTKHLRGKKCFVPHVWRNHTDSSPAPLKINWAVQRELLSYFKLWECGWGWLCKSFHACLQEAASNPTGQCYRQHCACQLFWSELVHLPSILLTDNNTPVFMPYSTFSSIVLFFLTLAYQCSTVLDKKHT